MSLNQIIGHNDTHNDNDNPDVVEEDKTTDVSSVSIALMMGG